MKKITRFMLFFLLLCVFLTGCNNQPELVEKLVDNTVKTTEKVIETKDVGLARDIWGQISQYGIKADELGEKDLAESLGELASTYVYLIKYLESGDESQLNLFNDKFGKAIKDLKKYMDFEIDTV